MRWPPFRHVFFDCDSTLTAVEGIDVLAEQAGRASEIRRLTDAAMNGEIDLEDVYGERLRQINPTKAQVAGIRHTYKEHAIPDARLVISLLQHLGHEVYIVSGGLEEPVREFGLWLGVPRDHIRAVGLEYDQLVGAWWSQHEGQESRYLDFGKGALAVSEGKAEIIQELRGDGNGRAMLVGDGTSDLLAGEGLDLFVGYGSVAARPKVKEGASVFIEEGGLAPVVPLAAGPSAMTRLEETSYRALFWEGIQAVQNKTRFTDGALQAKFAGAVASLGL